MAIETTRTIINPANGEVYTKMLVYISISPVCDDMTDEIDIESCISYMGIPYRSLANGKTERWLEGAVKFTEAQVYAHAQIDPAFAEALWYVREGIQKLISCKGL